MLYGTKWEKREKFGVIFMVVMPCSHCCASRSRSARNALMCMCHVDTNHLAVPGKDSGVTCCHMKKRICALAKVSGLVNQCHLMCTQLDLVVCKQGMLVLALGHALEFQCKQMCWHTLCICTNVMDVLSFVVMVLWSTTSVICCNDVWLPFYATAEAWPTVFNATMIFPTLVLWIKVLERICNLCYHCAFTFAIEICSSQHDWWKHAPAGYAIGQHGICCGIGYDWFPPCFLLLDGWGFKWNMWHAQNLIPFSRAALFFFMLPPCHSFCSTFSFLKFWVEKAWQCISLLFWSWPLQWFLMS